MAYTSASVDRSVTSNVPADSSAIIGLEAGSPAAITEDGDGRLSINTATPDSDGLNSNGEFTYGDESSPSSTYAFSITNNDGSAHNLKVSLPSMTLPGSSSFTISLYDTNDNKIGDVTSGNPVTYSSWSSTDTVYAVISIDTSGTSDSDSISGTVRFEA